MNEFLSNITFALTEMPFVPFIIRTSDGQQHLVVHPEVCYVPTSQSKIVIHGKEGFYRIINPAHVVSVEPVGGTDSVA
jgi:hypothetical protein